MFLDYTSWQYTCMASSSKRNAGKARSCRSFTKLFPRVDRITPASSAGTTSPVLKSLFEASLETTSGPR